VHENGREYCYQSTPDKSTDYQEMASDFALKIERLGLSRADARRFILENFEVDKIDLGAIFKKPKRKRETFTFAEFLKREPNAPSEVVDMVRRAIEEKGAFLIRGWRRRVYGQIIGPLDGGRLEGTVPERPPCF
jgi:hypothetical protein